MDNIQIATKIKQLCKNKNIMIKNLLNDCNIGKSFIYELSKRDKTPSIEKIALIADYLDVSIDYLVGRTNDPQSAHNNSNIEVSKNLIQQSEKDVMTKEESEILAVYRMLDVRDRTKLMSFIFDLEDNLQKMQ